MNLKYPLLLKSKLIEQVEIEPLLNGLDTKFKTRVIKICIELFLYISTAQQRQFDKDFQLKTKLKRMNMNWTDEKVSLQATLLDKKFRIPHFFRYNFFIKLLEDIQVISIYKKEGNSRGSYSPGNTSIRYGINPNSLKSFYGDIVYIAPDYMTDPNRNKTLYEWKQSGLGCNKLIENHYLATIDIEALENDLKLSLTLGEIDEIIYYKRLNEACAFNGRYFYFARQNGNPSGRFYSSFTNLPKTTRKHITLDGTKIVEIDMKNAQPLFLSYMLKHEEFRADCLEGIFWDKLSNQIQRDREHTKIQFFTNVLYPTQKRREKGLTSGLMYDALEGLYPGLLDMIQELPDSDMLWNKLQNIESSIFVDEMCRFDFPHLTIHDSLVVRNIKRDVERAVQALRFAFVNKGFKPPQFHIKKH